MIQKIFLVNNYVFIVSNGMIYVTVYIKSKLYNFRKYLIPSFDVSKLKGIYFTQTK
jgi:hypothetical protein